MPRGVLQRLAGPLRPGLILAGLLLGASGVSVRADTEGPCLPHVEEQRAWHTAILRPHTDAFRSCPMAEATYQRVVGAWLRQRRPEDGELASLGLGRVVDYPWLSECLARAALVHPAWNARTGRVRATHLNRLVADLLSEPAILARLRQPFDDSRYVVVSVVVEKVLVGRLGDVLADTGQPTLRVPFDALLWLRLEYRRPGG